MESGTFVRIKFKGAETSETVVQAPGLFEWGTSADFHEPLLKSTRLLTTFCSGDCEDLKGLAKVRNVL
jgi:hypothetical protein